MKKYRKISLSVLALSSLLSALFVTAAITGSTAHAQGGAANAQAFVAFSDGSPVENNAQAILTVGFAGATCGDQPVGGTLHGKREGSPQGGVALGVTNAPGVFITTHENEDTTAQTSDNAETCLVNVTVTANLNCNVAIRIGAATSDAAAVTKRPSASSTGTRALTFVLRGKTFSAVDADFFVAATVGAQTNLTPVPAAALTGTFELVSGAGVAMDIGLQGGATGLVARADMCDAPAATSFRIGNAEPTGSVNFRAQIEPQSNCNPGANANVGTINLNSGAPGTLQGITLPSSCVYNLTYAGAGAADITVGGLKMLCGAGAVLYSLNAGVLQVAAVAAGVTLRLAFSGASLTATIGTGTPITSVVQLTTVVLADCPSVGQARFQYTIVNIADEAVRNALAGTDLTVQIVPADSAPAGCFVNPGSFTITDATSHAVVANDATSKTETAFANAPRTATATVAIATRLRSGRSCSYKITYPRASGALTIATELTGLPSVSPAVDMRPVPAADGKVDGVVVRRANQLTGGVTTFGYTQRQLPINVVTNFDDDLVFTTEDIVRYRISVVGPCARFTNIVARALGSTGTFRSVQAYRGSTVILDNTLARLEESTSVEPDLLTSLQPVIIVRGEPVACTVEVEELTTPTGCTVVGGSVKTVAFSTGLDSFGFTFEHTCPGVATRASTGRGLTG